MDFINHHRIKPGKSVKLKSIETKESGPFEGKDDAKKPLEVVVRAFEGDLLFATGEDAGKPDGVIGSGTRAAIEGYQRQQGLAVTGDPSPDLLRRLR